MKYFANPIDKVVDDLKTDIDSGLKDSEAKARLEKYGLNKLKDEKKKSFISKLIIQFSDFLVLILIGAAIISFFIGEKKDAIMIISIVFVNAFLGIYQEGKAEKSLESLQEMSSSTTKVIRGNQLKVIPASKVVIGDIVQLDAGDIIPADIRLVDSANLKIEESSLTGESVPVEKYSDEVLDEDTGLGDRVNMVYMGTIVTYGRGLGIVVGTSHDTEIGNIATLIQSYDDEITPLQNQLNDLGKSLGLITIFISILVFIVGFIQNRPILDMFMIAISLAVAAIPEGLPAIVTIVLAIGMNRMVQKNAIVKKLLAVETLGSTTVICTDKTGTLTQNEMTVVRAYVDGKILEVSGLGYNLEGDISYNGEDINVSNFKNLKNLGLLGALTNDAELNIENNKVNIIGDPTEGSLLTFSGKMGITKSNLNSKYPRLKELSFDSNRKMMTTFHENLLNFKIASLTKGAPDIMIERCSRINKNNEIISLSEDMKKELLDINSKFSKKALRVLAFAYKGYDSLPKNISSKDNENDMIFLGLLGMIDPARSEAKDAIEKCKKAGIRTIMITGDYKETAYAIANELNIASSPDEAVLGSDLNDLSSNEIQELVKKTNVFARVTPENKVQIIDAFKANGDVVSMTGDGVNDAPALKKADIGVAMGITGTDVAKGTADMILTDDNFSTIVLAVEEGRIIYSNIKKFVTFLLSCNIGEIILVLACILMNLDIPLIPIQLLWVNLVTDSFPALALGVEKGEPDIMDYPPRDPDEPILTKSILTRVFFQGLSIAISSLIAFIIGMKLFPGEINKARTMVFTTLILSELLRAYSARSDRFTIRELGIFSNESLVLSTAFSFGLLILVLYIPFGQMIFETFALSLRDWAIVIPLSLIPLFLNEVNKLKRRND